MKERAWKKRSRYIGNQLYVSMDAAGRFSLPQNLLPKGYRVVRVDDEVHIIRDCYSNATSTRITISSQIRSDLGLTKNCIFKVKKKMIDGEERLVLTRTDEPIKW